MKNLVLAALAASLALAPGGTLAQPEDIIVSSARPIDQFVEEVSRDLDRQLKRHGAPYPHFAETGLTQVFFECGADGKPTNIRVGRKSGLFAGSTARRAVAKLRSLHPLPQGVSHDQTFLANVIIASDRDQLEELTEELQQLERERIAAERGGRKVFAFTLRVSPKA